MDAPPLRYVTTTDGYKIAYCEMGKGSPLVWMPDIWSNVQEIWYGPHAPALQYLAARHRLILYDGRGQGCSTRGLPRTYSLKDCERDLEAVVEALDVDSFFLYGKYFHGVVALRYAASHPERVSGLILRDVGIDYSDSAHLIQFAESNWDHLVGMLALIWFYGQPIEVGRKAIQDAITREDWLTMCKTVCEDHLNLTDDVVTPALVLAATTHMERRHEDARVIAATIPGSRLVTYPGVAQWWTPESGELPPVWLAAVTDFLDELAPSTRNAKLEPKPALTPREGEVLRLIASGQSSREISLHLVLSERTVARHITNIYAKIGVRSRAEATAYAFQRSLTG